MIELESEGIGSAGAFPSFFRSFVRSLVVGDNQNQTSARGLLSPLSSSSSSSFHSPEMIVCLLQVRLTRVNAAEGLCSG